MSIQMNVQSKAKKSASQKSEVFSSPPIVRMFEVLRENTLARILFLEKKKQARLSNRRRKSLKKMRIIRIAPFFETQAKSRAPAL